MVWSKNESRMGCRRMIDREKVIKGLECCTFILGKRKCSECPYQKGLPDNGCYQLQDDFHAMLQEQEAKCLTKAELDDLNENQFVWIEERTGHLYYLQIIGICRGKTGVSDIQFNAPTSYVERSTIRYGKSYRIWTDKPTKEQSQAVKWE